MTFKIIIQLSLLITYTYGYPYYPECSTFDPNATILNSLNGKIQGKCYNVPVNYGNKPQTTNQVLTWLAIPYAESPTGQLRFKNPVPIKSWKKTKDGTKWGKSCIQWDGDKIDKTSSENCLFLNIFTPYKTFIKTVFQNETDSKLPIFIWVHGGSNFVGSATDDSYEASTLVAMSNIIVVTINYRLGPFGFFNILNTHAKGNQGFLDQYLAFKWVYENAVLFGGDQTRITIGGESAGSWDVGFHLVHKPSWPYFSSAILQSGTPVDIASKLRTLEQGAQDAITVGKKLGCNIKNSTKLLDCLQKTDTKVFYEASSPDFESFVDLFMPEIYDGEVFTKQPRNSFIAGDFKKCNILVGSNTFEFLSFISDTDYLSLKELKKKLRYNPGNLHYDYQKYYNKYNLTNKNGFINKILDLYLPTDKLNNKTANFLYDYIDMITDECYKCPTYLIAEYYSKFNLSAYVYLYGHRISTSDLPFIDGAGHGEEITMMFAEPLSIKKPPLISWNSHSSTTHNYSKTEKVFSEQMVTYWTNFIKTGNPNNQIMNTNWPVFKDITNETNERNVFFLKAKDISNTKFNISDLKCKFWNL